MSCGGVDFNIMNAAPQPPFGSIFQDLKEPLHKCEFHLMNHFKTLQMKFLLKCLEYKIF
jgi:hypothetical protein